ncbi:MAG TPA: FIST N-terminal domain-containing protein, partial [Solirubrobacteraceae bacterium]
MKVAAGLSADPDPLHGATMAAREVADGLDGAEPDLAMVFASGAHLTVPEAVLAAIEAELGPETLVGCGAGGVLGAGRELESGTGVAVWAAALDAGSARPFHATVTGDGDTGVLEGLPELGADSALILLSDPYSFPTD